MEFRLLGPTEVRDGERVLPLGGRKRRAVLATLLLDANRAVAAERLVDALWGDAPPASAHSSLQNHVSRLRAVLGDRLVTRAPGYLLRVERGELDLDRFRELVDAARGADPAVGAERLREALALWRGPALFDLEGEPVHAAAAHLDDLRLAALEDRIDADLVLGRHADIVAELEAVAREHPFRERLQGQLVLALYRSGRQADALETYARARRALVEELGSEPGEALQALQRRILRHDDALAPPPAPTQPGTRVAPAPPETRRTVTVLAASLPPVDAGADPEARRSTLRRLSNDGARTVERHGGTPTYALTGDRVLAVFGAPVAHEDDALRAVRAAFDLRRSATVRTAALATGEVVTGSPAAGDALVSGAPVELADGLLAAADTDTIVACERTWRLVRHAVEGAAADGGFRLDRLDPEAPARARRIDTAFVGRAEELDEIERAFRRACREARPRLVTVFGEPGIGKTRLAVEAARRLRDEATVVTGACSAHREDATYAPLRDVVAAVAPRDPATVLRRLLADEPEGALVAERVAAATGLGSGSPGTVTDTAWAFRRLLEALARRQPLVLVLEDVQWAAPVLLELVEHVVDVGRAPILVLCLARPDLLDVRADWAGGKLNSVSLVLDALTPEKAEELLAQLAPEDALRPAARARIVGVAAGHPLYMEQLLAAALDEAPETVPDSISALLAARLDRLPTEERDALEAAAACGATFSSASIGELLERDARAALEALVRRDLLRPAEDPLFGEEAWAFRHALIRDAAYRSVPKRRRARLHEAYAGRVERLVQPHGVELHELIGYHLEQAALLRRDVGEAGAGLTALATRAGRALATAAERAGERNDRVSARSLVARALALLPEGDPLRDEALLALAETALWTEDRPAGSELVEQARASAERRGDERILARATITAHTLALWTDQRASPRRVLEDLERCIAVLERAGDHKGLAAAYQLQFHALDRGTEIKHPADALHRALHHARLADSQYLEGWALSWLCIVLPFGNVPVPAAMATAQGILETTENLGGRSAAQGALGLLHAMRGEFADARRLVLAAHALLGELGLPQAQAAQLIARAEVEILAGELSEAESLLRTGYERLHGLGDQHSTANVAWRLALVLARTGRDAEAETFTRVAEETAPHGFWVDVWWHVVRAGIAARAARAAEAERLLGSALDLVEGWETGMQVDAWIEAAGVLRALGRAAEGDALLRRAGALARDLGYTVAERRVEELTRR